MFSFFQYKNLDTEALIITHCQANKAPKNHRRMYRAHGRITPFNSHPAHLQMIMEEPQAISENLHSFRV